MQIELFYYILCMFCHKLRRAKMQVVSKHFWKIDSASLNVSEIKINPFSTFVYVLIHFSGIHFLGKTGDTWPVSAIHMCQVITWFYSNFNKFVYFPNRSNILRFVKEAVKSDMQHGICWVSGDIKFMPFLCFEHAHNNINILTILFGLSRSTHPLFAPIFWLVLYSHQKRKSTAYFNGLPIEEKC